MNSDLPLQVNEKIEIGILREEDLPVLADRINDPSIYENTLLVPYPYSLSEAEVFFDHVWNFKRKHGFFKDFIIRLEGELVGGIGLMFNHGILAHRSEFGYWLARDFRNRGIMSGVIPAFVRYVFDVTRLIRLEAHVFPENTASIKVLEKLGFRREGYLRRSAKKDGEYKDTILFAILKG